MHQTQYKHQQLIFDMDDTLIYCNKYFYFVIEQFLDVMSTWFHGYEVTTNEFKQKQIEIDLAYVNHSGFVSEHFPQSFVETYRHFGQMLGRTLDRKEETQLWQLGRSVYKQLVEPYPGMIETLTQLRDAGHTLYLYTGGELNIQQRKIDDMKLQDFFDDRIYIRQHKNSEALESILKGGDFDRSRTWMIGNSLRTDVTPALKAGLSVIYLKQPNEWKYNMVDLPIDPNATLYTVTSLTEVPEIVAAHLNK